MRALLTILLVSAFVGDSVTLRYFNAELAGNGIEVSWETDKEEAVRTYELFRKTSFATDFAVIESVDPHGTGSVYRVLDDEVYKVGAEQIDYRLEVVFTSGVRQRLAEKKVNYTPTAIRRSWGSIKAMFQF